MPQPKSKRFRPNLRSLVDHLSMQRKAARIKRPRSKPSREDVIFRCMELGDLASSAGRSNPAEAEKIIAEIRTSYGQAESRDTRDRDHHIDRWEKDIAKIRSMYDVETAIETAERIKHPRPRASAFAHIALNEPDRERAIRILRRAEKESQLIDKVPNDSKAGKRRIAQEHINLWVRRVLGLRPNKWQREHLPHITLPPRLDVSKLRNPEKIVPIWEKRRAVKR